VTDTPSRLLPVPIGLVVSFDALGQDRLADLLAALFVTGLVVIGAFELLTLRDEQPAPSP
jgi:hypothetical protein